MSAVAACGGAALQGCGSGDSAKVVARAGSSSVGDAGDGGANDAGAPAGGASSGAAGANAAGEAGDSSQGGSAGDAGASGEAGSAGAAGAGTADWHLWVLDRNKSHLYGYAPSQLEITNGDAPEIDITLADLPSNLVQTHLQFDAQGNLWIGDLNTYRFNAADLKATGTAHLAATLKYIGGNYGRVAFDPAGNLWRSSYTSPALTRFDAGAVATLTTTKIELVPNFTVSSASDWPIEFDGAGNLYTGVYATQGPTTGPNFFGRFDASQLVGNGTTGDPPALSIIPRIDATDLVRTAGGDFVIANGSATLTRFTKAQAAQSGLIQEITPDAQLTISAPLVPAATRVVVDPDGNLYVSETTARVLKLAAADVAKKGVFTITPAMTLRAQAADVNAQFQGIAVH